MDRLRSLFFWNILDSGPVHMKNGPARFPQIPPSTLFGEISLFWAENFHMNWIGKMSIFFWILVLVKPNIVDVWIEKKASSRVWENIYSYEDGLKIIQPQWARHIAWHIGLTYLIKKQGICENQDSDMKIHLTLSLHEKTQDSYGFELHSSNRCWYRTAGAFGQLGFCQYRFVDN